MFDKQFDPEYVQRGGHYIVVAVLVIMQWRD